MISKVDLENIPESHLALLGHCRPGTRIYEREGTRDEAAEWYDLVTATVGPTISTGAVRLYADISRAALYDRLVRGRLTMFQFTIKPTGLAGEAKSRVRKDPFAFVPLSECRQWREEIERRGRESEQPPTGGEEETALSSGILEALDAGSEPMGEADDDRLTIPLSTADRGEIERVAQVLQYPTGTALAAEVFRRLIRGGFSGYNFTKVGFWLMLRLERLGRATTAGAKISK